MQVSIESIKKNNIKILIGDSEKGVDKEIIDFLMMRKFFYPNVEIYTIKKLPRVLISDEWIVNNIKPDNSLNGQQNQMLKDRAMADKADWGLAIFRPLTKNRYGALQVSSGTLRNSIQMLLNHKKVKFFYAIDNEIKVKNLNNLLDLKNIIDEYKHEKINNSEKEMILGARGINTDDVNFIKFTKINKKFNDLLKKEEKIIKQKGKFSNEGEQTSLFK